MSSATALCHFTTQHSDKISKEGVDFLQWMAQETILCKATGRDLSLISVLSNKLAKTQRNKLSLQ